MASFRKHGKVWYFRFTDADGKKYLDFSAQLMCVTLGHKNQAVIQAIQEQARKLAYVGPGWATEVRADLVSNVVQPGRFSKLEANLTLHIRERRPTGQLLGIFIDDQRNPKERASILAENGDIVKN